MQSLRESLVFELSSETTDNTVRDIFSYYHQLPLLSGSLLDRFLLYKTQTLRLLPTNFSGLITGFLVYGQQKL